MNPDLQRLYEILNTSAFLLTRDELEEARKRMQAVIIQFERLESRNHTQEDRNDTGMDRQNSAGMD